MSYIDDINIYNDPIIANKRKGNADSPFMKIVESLTVEDNGKVLLTEIPNKKERVVIKNGDVNLAEVDFGIELSNGLFSVDYPNGIVYFDNSVINQTLTFTYLGEGARYFPSSRIWVENDNSVTTAKDKFSNLDNEINEQKSRVDNLITSTPQPAEILDVRVDKNGQTFTTAKDRVDAEQAKIENAYTDANGKVYSSLKERIDVEQQKLDDSLNSATLGNFSSLAERLDAIDDNLNSFNQNIASMQDSLTLKLNSTDFNGSNIVSQIELTPDTIKISANKINLNGAIGINALDPTVLDTVNNAISKSNINLNGSLPTAIAMDTNGITAYTSDTTKYARLNQNGLYIKNGALTIERPDGYQVINNGTPTSDYTISGASPAFMAGNVSIWGYFYKTTSGTATNCDFFSFKHTCRYLKVLIAMYCDNANSGSRMSFWDWYNLSAPLASYVTYETNPNAGIAAGAGVLLTIDLGVPDGSDKGIYAMLNTGTEGNTAYGRIIRMWKEG